LIKPELNKCLLVIHTNAHLLVGMHLAAFAPAFTFSLCESESSRKPQVRIVSVVGGKAKKTHTPI